MICVPSSLVDGWQVPPGGGLGPQGAGRTPVDGASWPALSSALAPAPRACPPSSAFWGEEQALGGLTALSSPGRVSPSPRGHAARRDLRPGAQAAHQGARNHSRLCCCSEKPREQRRPAPRPEVLPGQRTTLPAAPQPSPALPPLPARNPGSPSAVPRDLSYTGPGGCGHVPASPSKRSPLSAKPGRAGGRDEAPAGD